MIRVLVADDHPTLRAGVLQAIKEAPDIEVVGEAGTGPELWARLAEETLSTSYYYEFPGHGHGIMRSDRCGFEIGFQFLNDPTNEPDASCLDEITGIEFE